MRKLPSPSQAADTSIIHHFSHPHPLQLFNHRAQQTHNLDLARWLCACCKLKVSDDSAGWIYTCLICNYFLHISCSKMPQQITHPIDQNHPLSLLTPNPMCILYPETQGFFRCDACGKQGNGFSYHCGTCNIDLHPICSTMPLTLTHQSHHHHHLNLTFSPPYNNKIFSCDICKNMGSKEWLYRCNMCEFDAHLVCATSTTKARAPIQQAHQQQQQQQHRAPTPPSVVTSYNNFNNLQVPGPTGTGYLNNGVQSYNYFNNDPAGPGVAAGRNMQQSGLSNQQVIRFLANATIPGLGLLMQGLSGGGGSSGDGSLSSFNVDLSGMDFGAMGMGGSDIGGFGGF